LKLRVKFVIYNAVSKALIIGAFGMILPVVVQQIVYRHIDKRLEARKDLLLKKIHVGGLDQALLEEDCSFDDYNIFKEEFIKIQPLYDMVPDSTVRPVIANEEWNIEETVQQMHRVIRVPFLYDNQWYELNIGEGISSIDALNKTIVRFSFWAMIIIIVVSVFVDMGFVEILLRPFHRIVANKLRAARDPSSFNMKPVKSSTNEFAYLDESINDLMRKIRDAFMIERQFISNVSHELLTPISILQSRLENIVADEKTPPTVAEKILESQKTLHRLLRIVRSLLMISKIENEQYLKDESCDLRSLAEEVEAEIEDRLEQKGITLTTVFDAGFTFTPCNRSLLHTMLFNLVNNAIKYNHQGGSITLHGHPVKDGFALDVTDTGVGIDPAHLDAIFERFRKIRSDDENSFGLGLPIVKTIAQFHRILVSVKSNLGTGTTFTLLFPAH